MWSGSRRAFFRALGATARLGGERVAPPFAWAPRALANGRDALWAFLGEVMSAAEKSRLGVALYDASDEYRGSPRHAWEDAWLARRLPPPPARVLVGAAGAGREVTWLLSRSYDVVALEPSRELAALCRARMTERAASRASVTASENTAASDDPAPHDRARVIEARHDDAAPHARARVIEARYEDVAAGAVDLGARGETFDAVLLGLGSLSHVLDADDREALMRTLAKIAPRGPILASVLAPPRRPRGTSRATRFGRTVAAPLRALRHLPPVDANEIVFGGLGFAKLFTRAELATLGESFGREAAFDDAPDGMELCAFAP